MPGTTIDCVAFQRAAEAYPVDDLVVTRATRWADPPLWRLRSRRGITFAPGDKIFREVVGQIVEAGDQAVRTGTYPSFDLGQRCLITRNDQFEYTGTDRATCRALGRFVIRVAIGIVDKISWETMMRLTVWALMLSSAASAQTAGVTLSSTDTPAPLMFGGPPIPIVQAIAVDPVNHGVLYASVDRGYDIGVFRSGDSGARWSLLSAFEQDNNIRALAIDPTTPTTIYAGAYTGVFKSIDGGTTWSLMNTGLGDSPAPVVTSLAIDPSNPSTLYTTVFKGLFKSVDGGTSWSSASVGLPSPVLLSLSVNPVNTATVYAIVYGRGVFKSTNGASNWAASNTGLPSDSVGGVYVNALVINPANSATLYTATFGNGIFKSTDGGANWSPVNTGLADLHVGNLDSGGELAIDPGNPDTLYTATGSGVFKTVSGGLSWAPANTGLTPPAADPSLNPFASWSVDISGLVVDPTNSATVYLASALGGVYKSTDGASTWSAAGNGVSSTPVIRALAIDRSNPANIYAGTFAGPGTLPFLSGGIFQSPNRGVGWKLVSFGFVRTYVQTLAIDPGNPSTVYAAPWLDTVGIPSGGGVIKSTDGGAIWKPANSGLPFFTGYANGGMYSTTTEVDALAVDPTNSATVYAAVGCGIFKTTDGGANWSSASSGAASSCTSNLIFSSIAVDPSNPTTIYAGSAYAGTLFQSLDGGGTWSPFGSTLPTAGIPALAVAPGSPSTVYAGTKQSGIFTSIDGGVTWTAANSGLPNLPILALAVDPPAPQTIYAGTGGNGVFKSTDAGATWQATGANTRNGFTPCNFRGVRRQPDGTSRTIIAFPTRRCRD